ncbi:hypothetical protein [Bernardetia sp.]|uniref:hypothetical protein n=1 Tax=Bernardetia sp. TaxID=1937974 RepID=UPI0025C67134|nr:hypothetical protein [Bernardetia sp.]
MFNTPYKFNYLGHTKTKTEPFNKLHKFAFKCRFNHRYIVRVEEYENLVFVVKFYLKNHENSDKKYQLLSGFNDVARVISTNIEIMFWLYQKNDLSLFGFIGANSEDEEVAMSKRFKVYSKVMLRCFSPNKFFHRKSSTNSAYLLLNKKHIETEENLEELIKEMFIKYYDMSL